VGLIEGIGASESTPTASDNAPVAEAAREELPSEDVVVGASAEEQNEGPKYYIQICTLSKYSDPNDPKFGPYRGKVEQKQTSSGSWRCVIPVASLEEACKLQPEVAVSFPGAFVVAFEGDYFRRL
jgi:hypothetical protein